MSRKVILTLAAAATLAVASLASSSTYARGFAGGGGFGRGHMTTARGGSAGPVRNLRVSRIGRTGNPGKPGQGGKLCLLGHPCHPNPPIIVGNHHHHHHWHWVFRDGRWLEIDDVVGAAAVDVAPASVPGPCTCLTKTYTPAGLVVFADVCTKESVSAPAVGDTSDATQAPSTMVPANATPIAQVPTAPNYAGRNYQDYLAANPQAAQPQVSSEAPQQGSSASQQN